MASEKPVRTVLVTGGGGYLGSVLVPKLLEQGFYVKVLDCFYFGREPLRSVEGHPRLTVIEDEMLNHENHPDLFSGVDAVIHLASISNDPSADLDPNLTVRVNFFATVSLARRARLEGVRRFVFMSSCSVYGGAADKILNERSETGPLTLYALTKLQSESSLMELNAPGFAMTVFRSATLFGFSPRMRFDLAVNVMVKRAYQGHPLIVHGDGKQYRPFLHVEDAADALMDVISRNDNAASGKILNLGLDELNYRISDLARAIHARFPSLELTTVPESADARSYRVSFQAVREGLGIVPKRDIGFAIDELVQAFEDGIFGDMDDERYYNLMILKKANPTFLSYYSPAATPNWSGVILKGASVIPLRRKKTIAVVLAYNCERMIGRAYERIPKDLVDDIIVMDDGSRDKTYEAAQALGLKVFRNEKNLGYGGNLKAGMKKALEMGAEYIVEVHGDGAQFNPASIAHALPHMQSGADLILGSRFQNKWLALANGMPYIRFFANIFLSFFDRLVLRLPLTEFHTGFRIYGRSLLQRVPYERNADNYLFSFQIIAQAAYYRRKVAEVPVEADYHAEHTSHSIRGASVYAVRTFVELGKFLLARAGLRYCSIFDRISESGLKVPPASTNEVTKKEAADGLRRMR
ncbi:MAG: hypothetical protein A2X94_02250 [Bdellovibrionales bacterium GWB1_55_8]|nr:MAG: hypothetical protein A2X94_02250 [Bdellovibrionales bacterium GWB1_55_8]